MAAAKRRHSIDRQGKQTQDKLSFSQLGTNCDAMNGVKKKRQTV
jgi:hypothetical protein